jgi:hypothetical protein
MKYSFRSVLLLGIIIIYSCQGASNNTGADSHSANTTTAEEHVVGDIISTQKEDFDVDQFIKEKKEAEKKAELASVSNKAEISAQKESAPVAAKPKKKAKPVKKYYPEIEFVEETYQVGDITEGDVIKHIFKFKNIGKAPLNIEKAEGTCGCTQPSYPFLEIAPGEEGEIGVNYHSVGKSGPQKPEIIVYSDAKNEPVKTLFLELNVQEKPSENTIDTLAPKEG